MSALQDNELSELADELFCALDDEETGHASH
jgi:hypothetical protein